MRLSLATATVEDVPALTALHAQVSADLTRRFGQGGWSGSPTARGVAAGMRHTRVVVARRGKRIVGALTLQTKKPWAIDVAYFTPVTKALYVTGMAVAPEFQRQGIGRRLMDEAERMTRAWPAQAIRLDAFDAEAGAGGFYAKCGMQDVGHVRYRTSLLIYFELIL
ncbi:MAG TPA: GNAT family N-acetyltransferase [Acidobacteriaceae bacterium]|jgi:ribosomal protein S18 acetylase RimI-like enzyme|nr:GNAT family N-acetyltransferase [Acidobacteriaceae bacterium]